MSNPIEPKFPKRRFNAMYDRDITAPNGYYLLPPEAALTKGDWSWIPGESGGWTQPGGFACQYPAGNFAWTYARKLPDGQLNDDLLVQSTPDLDITVGTAYAEEQRRRGVAEAQIAALRKQVAEFDSAMGSSAYEREQATIRCRAAEEQAAQLRDALHAVYENCRQNRNKGIGAGPLAMARSALVAAGVELKAPLQWEGAPEAEQQFSPTDPRTLAREKLQAWGDIARAALERNAAATEQRRKLFHESQVTALIREFVPALLQHHPDLRPVDAARQAAEMARIAMEKAAAFSVETSAPSPPEPMTFPEGTVLFPGGPVLRMTHDGKVTAFGAVEAPPGCYLLPAGEPVRPGDLYLSFEGAWLTTNVSEEVQVQVQVPYQFTYARKLPPAEGRADG